MTNENKMSKRLIGRDTHQGIQSIKDDFISVKKEEDDLTNQYL